MVNYFVVLFKNKLKKKIIKKFVTLKKATQFYEKNLAESNDVIFDAAFCDLTSHNSIIL
jgi:hypothetical protein